MLHDLYLLTCYFEPTNAILYEEDLNRRYGAAEVVSALKLGLLERYCAPCARQPERFYCRLSTLGLRQIETAIA